MDPDLKESRHHIRGSIVLLAFRVFVVLLFLNAIYGALLLWYAVTPSLHSIDNLPAAGWGLHLALFFVETFLVIRVVLKWATTVYYVADHHLIRFAGVVVVDESVYELEKLRRVKLHQTLLGRVFGFGDVQLIFSVSGYHDEVVLQGIDHAHRYEHYFRSILEEPADTAEQTDVDTGRHDQMTH